ncbi:MAG: DNA-processing protein DprA [Thiogranum sp.]|nr:DNA-processing protein DprA [Thiogranum sp.]
MGTQTDTQSAPARADLHYWLALHRAPEISARRYRALIDEFGSPAAVFDASHEKLRRNGVSALAIDYLKKPDWPTVEKDLLWLREPGNQLLCYGDPSYPMRLAEISDPPALLFTHGDQDYLSQPQLAIVGSRNPTRDGQELAREFASYLVSYGLTITSGLASGIDGAAHQGALDGGGTTIAVMGTGLDRVYPSRHRKLAHQIAENGVLVSEFPPGTAPTPSNFPRRNRIISGLSVGTLVVEAALRSGSLITARIALEQGREVFAIPGSIHNPLTRGCHALIRQGAKLVETGEHVLEELAGVLTRLEPHPGGDSPPENRCNRTATPGKPGEDYLQLLDLMGYHSVSVDQLVQRSGLTPQEVSSMLLVLELDDYVVSSAGGRYTRTR